MSAYAKGNSLIENVKTGISVEYDRNTEVNEVEKQINQFLINIGIIKGLPRIINQENYKVYNILKKTNENKFLKLENFVETEYKGERFIPILYGEEAYKEVLCMKAKRI